MLGSIGAAAGGNESEQKAMQLVERMARAARELNYDGNFVYSHGSQMDEMRIIHRNDGSGEQERLISLSGVRREVLRDNMRVTCILPDDQAVVVGKSRPQSTYGSPVLSADNGYQKFYRFKLGAPSRVAERPVYFVRIEPRDEYRFGYHLWTDQGSGLLLRSHLLDESGAVLERILYTRIELPERIEDSMLEPEIEGTEFTWHTPGEGATAQTDTQSGWTVRWLPPGFTMRDKQIGPMATGRMPVYHTVYGDGLASFSIYIEEVPGSEQPLEGAARMGAMTAFGRVVDQYQITVVGEVPMATVTRVGESVAIAE
ncbi:MAG: MucB/RseB C-terminal domain-containing protein [Gammaproteobacteria bacterium]|nr:MucB/RseB C-terminal domain-containing protein [Gammaproteobacteria bacterium]